MKFLGKSYRYKDKVIIKATGSYTRIKSKAFPLCLSIEEAQKNLDQYAAREGLLEND